MSWAIGRPAAVLERLARGLVARVRPSADAAVNPAGVSPPDESAKAASDAPPRQAPDALRLRPEVEKPLLVAGMPPEGWPIYNGRKRAADTPDASAHMFVLWARAGGRNVAYSVDTIIDH